MKYCSTCGKQLQYYHAEICPGCGCRVDGAQKGGGFIGVDKIIAFFLAAIFIVLCVIAITIIIPAPPHPVNTTAADTSSAPATDHPDNSLSVEWNTMDDWNGWEHTAAWSGEKVGPCTEYGPRIVNSHGEYGTVVNLMGGSTESGIWRTFSQPSGPGWNTLTLVGRLSGTDVPAGRWIKIEVNDRPVYEADVTHNPPGNNMTFTLPVHFSPAKEVKVKISNGQKPMWGPAVRMEYYSLRLSLEKTGAE